VAQLPAAIPAAIAAGVAAAMAAIANVPVPVTTFLQFITSMLHVYAVTYLGQLIAYTTAGTPPQSTQAQMTVITATFPHDTIPSVFLYQDSHGMIWMVLHPLYSGSVQTPCLSMGWQITSICQ
jgi:hypothetical protein